MIKISTLLAILGGVLIGLKVAGVTTLSWLWVLAPLWVLPAILIAVLLVGMIVAGIGSVIIIKSGR